MLSSFPEKMSSGNIDKWRCAVACSLPFLNYMIPIFPEIGVKTPRKKQGILCLWQRLPVVRMWSEHGGKEGIWFLPQTESLVPEDCLPLRTEEKGKDLASKADAQMLSGISENPRSRQSSRVNPEEKTGASSVPQPVTVWLCPAPSVPKTA